MNALPESLLDAIWDAAGGDETEAERLAQRWQQVIPEMEARSEHIRAQVRESVCHCVLEPESITTDGRCERCFGRRQNREGDQ
jgi:hypothetical protein